MHVCQLVDPGDHCEFADSVAKSAEAVVSGHSPILQRRRMLTVVRTHRKQKLIVHCCPMAAGAESSSLSSQAIAEADRSLVQSILSAFELPFLHEKGGTEYDAIDTETSQALLYVLSCK